MAVEHLQTPSSQGADGVTSQRVPLIAYARDRETLNALSEGLGPALGSAACFHLGSIRQARLGVQRLDAPVSALLVDVSNEGDPLGALEDLALYVEPGVRVVVIGDIADMDFYRQVTRGLGVHDYLCKPLTRDTIGRNLLPMLTGDMLSPSRGGRIVTVTGVRGGVGATTVAVNLAAQLAERSRHHILLFDANLNLGTAPLMLGTDAGGGLREALETPSRVDSVFTERATVTITDRLHVLAAEESLEEAIMPAPGGVEHLTDLLCNRYNLVITDLPAYPTPLNLELRRQAHVRVLVLDPTLPSLRDALRHLSLPSGPRQAARPIVVLNRVGMPGSLTQKQIAEGLGADIDVTIPWMPQLLKSSMGLGKPAIRSRGLFQAAISRLADELLPHRSESRRRWVPWRTRTAA